MMDYHITRNVGIDFDEAIARVTEELKKEGFGILTEIDVKSTLKEKIDVDFRRYRILGACNPPLAHRALLAEDKIGLMLPCNVIIQQSDSGEVEISTINPLVAMKMVPNEGLDEVAEEATARLRRVIDAI